MRLLVDTNIVLDVLLDRAPFADAAVQIFGMIERSVHQGFLGATTVTTIDYLLGRHLDRSESRRHLESLLGLFSIAPVNRSVLERALRSKIPDFEDAVLEQAALLCGVEVLITRNVRDFTKATLKVFEPIEFLASATATATPLNPRT